MDPNYPSRLNDYLHFRESDDDSDSDFDPDEYESSDSETDDDFEDSDEDEETDLTHLDTANIITGGLYPQEREQRPETTETPNPTP